jgi:hypothetical protein
MALGMQLKRIWRRIWSPSLKRRRRQNRAIVVAVALLLPAGIAALAINWNVIVNEVALDQTMISAASICMSWQALAMTP